METESSNREQKNSNEQQTELLAKSLGCSVIRWSWTNKWSFSEDTDAQHTTPAPLPFLRVQRTPIVDANSVKNVMMKLKQTGQNGPIFIADIFCTFASYER